MKALFFIASLVLFLNPLSSTEIDATTYSSLVAGISRAQKPHIYDNYVVFTAKSEARFTGIAFEHERYATLHPFERIVRKNTAGDETGNILFYILKVPPQMSEIRYRMVIDGLWSTDPLNSKRTYDHINGMYVSSVSVGYYEIFQTSNIQNGMVRFTWQGESGKTIRLAGTFNNWDPFMYVLEEHEKGKYELNLPLPRGTWLYAFFDGMTQLSDTINNDRLYTKDGRVASVITVK